MTRLQVFEHRDASRAQSDTTERSEIERALGRVGIRFERWRAGHTLPAGARESDIVRAYHQDIDRLRSQGGYQAVDVVRMQPDNADRVAIRRKFLKEHTHAEDEVRFFVEGTGQFCLHVGEAVHVIQCERDDLIAIPAGTRHWFDMGPEPFFAAIRLFIHPGGWVAQFTESDIAERFPRFEPPTSPPEAQATGS
jgi:1,2-dihydroxy-3-keto-5-methylthiopentene dioxygenase